MADFRKCLLAFAVLALLSSFAVPANAQTAPALQCTTNASVTPTVRAEGLAELVGDIVLNCTGGTSTANGATVQAANIVIFLSTNITSRAGDVLLMIDEPHSPANPTAPLTLCNLPFCPVAGTGSGAGTYDGSTGRPNVFKASAVSGNSVTFLGIPIDPPGTNPNRTIRITNIRGNANLLNVSSTLIPTQIVANISVSPPTILPLNNPQQLVAFVQRGLVTSVHSATSFVQCVDENADLADDPTADGTSAFSVRFEEGFATAWKERNIAQHLYLWDGTAGQTFAQDVPGSSYFSESGFNANGNFNPTASTPLGYGPFMIPPSPAVAGLENTGQATQGTRLMVTFNNIPATSSGFVGLFVPTQLNIVTQSGTNDVTGSAYLVATADSSGGGGFTAVSVSTGTQISTSAGTGNSGLLSPVSVFNGTGFAVYEVVHAEPFALERMDVPVVVAFAAGGGDFPAPGQQASVTASFAPVSSVGTASETAPIPRFAPGTSANAFIITKCSCNMLFPFVSNQAGFDTGVAISNTSADPFGTTAQTGNVTLNYYSAGTPPPLQVTTSPVPAGDTLTFSLSGGGNFGITPTPGFQGYIIAQADFQYCHGVAYLSGVGNPYSGLGYLGIILDKGTLERTGTPGEVKAH